MAEGNANVELAHDLSHHHQASAGPHAKLLGTIEAIVLAIVAVATAWGGYQASRWNGVSATDYAEYERYTVLAQEKMTLAGQDRLYDIVTFNGWVTTMTAQRTKLAAFYVRRFRPEYRAAFDAWWKLDPVHNASAPPGPIFMKEYVNANDRLGAQLSRRAEGYAEHGTRARERGDDYVRLTVFLATALFLTALSQRFEFAGPRIVVVAIAALLMITSVFWLVTLPRT